MEILSLDSKDNSSLEILRKVATSSTISCRFENSVFDIVIADCMVSVSDLEVKLFKTRWKMKDKCDQSRLSSINRFALEYSK